MVHYLLPSKVKNVKVVKFDDAVERHKPGQEWRRVRLLATPEITGSKSLTVGHASFGPGNGAPFHAHPGEETMFITHGKAKFYNKSEEITVTPGTLLYYPAGEEHRFENIASQSFEFLFVYTPAGSEDPLKKWELAD